MATEAAKLIARVGADIRDYQQKMGQADQLMKGTSKSMGAEVNRMAGAISGGLSGIAGIAGVGAVALLAKEAVGAAWDLANLGAQANRLETSFQGLAGAGADRMLERLRTVSRGTISDMQLMSSASRAMMLGVTDDADTMAKLLEVAMFRGRAMGLTAQQAFSDLMTGLGRMSPMILDNLGILTGGQKVFTDYAASIGKASDELTDLEKRQALVNLVLRDSQGTTVDAAEGIETLTAALANFKVAASEYVMFLAAGAGATADFVNTQTDAMKATMAASQVMAPYNAILSEQIQYLQLGEQEAQRRITGLRSIESALREGLITEEQAIATTLELLGVARSWRDELTQMEPQLRAGTELHQNLASAIYGVASAWRSIEMPSEAELSKLARTQWSYAMGLRAGDPAAQISLIEDQQRKLNLATAVGQDEWWGLETQRLSLLQGINKELESEATKHAEKMVSIEKQYYSEIRSLVQAGLQPTQVTRMDVLATKFGKYKEKPDEYLRQLQAGLETPTGEYGGMLGGRRGEEAEFYVGQMREAFAGYDIETLKQQPGFDYNQMIQSLVDQIKAQQAAEAGLDQITADVLTALGGAGAIGEAEVKAMLGQPLMLQGEKGAEDFAEGWKGEDLGQIFTSSFDAQLTAQEQRWVGFGGLIIEWMGDGMKDGLHGEFVAALVDVLVPKVKEELDGVN